ncbi:hypothetical protein GMORB2_5441 [Geosmithia morbida]|uniref:Proteophosphoglycan ppg4 n=1 Tax=Geosmithia morbida TaxID=1094350 RepID=A0A9P5D6H8_9HYPO|nr:uncharacterized protein GMORB2_5441 [Geosmithia morbida]KAF4124775.1 hypothetical protein GMORB2_5441 [Geosmithia morbida]
MPHTPVPLSLFPSSASCHYYHTTALPHYHYYLHGDGVAPSAWTSRRNSQRFSRWRRSSHGSTTRMRPNLLPSLNTSTLDAKSPESLTPSPRNTAAPPDDPSLGSIADVYDDFAVEGRSGVMYDYQWPMGVAGAGGAGAGGLAAGDYAVADYVASPVSPTAIPDGPFFPDRDHDSSPLARSQSDLSMYVPTRRRSIVQVPGVATRTEPRWPPSQHGSMTSSMTSRQSFPAAIPDDSSSERNSFESYRRRHLSMPLPPSLDLDAAERAGTPPNIEFRQLGAIKFGSLHITNGTPNSTPGPEDETRTTHGSPLVAGDGGGSSSSAAPTSSPVGKQDSLRGVAKGSAVDATDLKHPRPLSATAAAVAATAAGTTPSGEHRAGGAEIPAPGPHPRKGSSSPDKAQVDLGRSDSGVGSATSSTGSSSDPVPTADSGYGSMLSLKSFFGSRKSTRRSKGAATVQGSEAQQEPSQMERPRLRRRGTSRAPATEHDSQDSSVPAPPPAASPEDDDSAKADSKDDGLWMPRRRNILGSIKAKKTQLSTQSPKLKHSRGSSNPEGAAVKPPSSSPGPSPGADQVRSPSKLTQKISLGSRRRSLPNLKADKAKVDQSVPSMPSNAAEKLQEHNGDGQPTSRRRSFFRASPRTESITTMNTAAGPDANAVAGAGAATSVASYGNTSLLLSIPGQGSASGSNSRGPLSRSVSVISSKPTGQRKSILRRSRTTTVGSCTPRDRSPAGFGEYDGLDVQAASVSNIRRSVGNSAFDQALVAMNRADPDPAVEEALRRGPPRIPGGGNYRPYPRLRTRSSAPDFLETVSEPAEPGSVDCYSQKKPKTPPPLLNPTSLGRSRPSVGGAVCRRRLLRDGIHAHATTDVPGLASELECPAGEGSGPVSGSDERMGTVSPALLVGPARCHSAFAGQATKRCGGGGTSSGERKLGCERRRQPQQEQQQKQEIYSYRWGGTTVSANVS